MPVVTGVLGGLFLYTGCLMLGMTNDEAFGAVVAYTGMRIWASTDKR
jgi:hypothetical protein